MKFVYGLVGGTIYYGGVYAIVGYCGKFLQIFNQICKF